MRSINSFAAAVHRWRRERGMSLGDVAVRAGYSVSYLSKMLHGHRRLLPSVVTRIDEVLGASGELERIARDQEPSRRPPPRPMQLPSGAADFVGREAYLHQLDTALITRARPGAAVTIVIEGGFWVGKTELALQWAARVQSRFPGGCLFADMRGLAPGVAADPDEVLDAFLQALGAPPEALRGSTGDRAAHFRSLLAQRPALVVLDNIASYDQVHHLLPGAGSAVVLTSREHQAALLLRSGGLHMELPPLSREEALTLLRRRVGEARVDVEVSAAEALIERCGRLPMAVLIAAEHILQHHHGSLAALASELTAEARRLDLFASTEPAVNIHGVIDLSYLALPLRARRVFRLTGISPAPLISAESTAALTGLSRHESREDLDLLRAAHLLEDVQGGRFRMNDLLHAYAHQRAVVEESLAEVERAHDRVLRWYTATAWHAANALAPHWSGMSLAPPAGREIEPLTFEDSGYEGAMAWCDAEVETAIHVGRRAKSHVARDAVWMLPTLFLPYFYIAKQWGNWLTAATDSLAAARRSGSHRGMAWCLHSLGWAQHELGRTDEALHNLRDALRLRNELGDDDRVRGWTLFALGTACLGAGEREEARRHLDEADQLFAGLAFSFGRAFTCASLAHVHQAFGDVIAATQAALDALTYAQEVPAVPVLSLAHHQYGLLLLEQRHYRTALSHFDAALRLRRASRERWGEADTLIARADALSKSGNLPSARVSYHEAAEILEALHDPRALDIRTRIAKLNAELDDAR
ncbi:tetratricopeptide repeat protein [Amycolatopsis thermoflava]|uniref:tetratricopeptide repeat protein n=1 Tax=Amycolatopsis thermoflava TaxID=84480 RepID=UPI003D73A57E